jgi:hypothetical protein
MMQDRSSSHGSMSDEAAGARTCILPERYTALFSTSTSLSFADSRYANPKALAIWRQTGPATSAFALLFSILTCCRPVRMAFYTKATLSIDDTIMAELNTRRQSDSER